MHHVRARTPRFACGGDDYLYFVLFHGSFQVRAIASPATALAAAAAAIACAAVGMRLLCSSCVPSAHGPVAGCGLLLYTRAALGS